MPNIYSKVTQIPIFIYHSISNCNENSFKEYAVPLIRFNEQLEYLHNHNYNSLTVSQLASILRFGGADLPDRPVVLSFDDGFADFFTTAFPALRHYGFSATVYVVTAFVGDRSRWLGEINYPMISWDQLSEIRTYGIEIGTHSHTHPPLDLLSNEAAYEEMSGSKLLMEDKLQMNVSSMAYPFGFYSKTTMMLAQKAGYSSSCAVNYKFSSMVDDPFTLSRIIVPGNADIDLFEKLLTGRGLLANTTYKRVRSCTWRLIRHSLHYLTERLYSKNA